MNNCGELNPIQAGRRVHAVFGFCDIRNFTDSTEILQTKVMTFVNQIAEITHTCVNKFGGAANKNIGDAFLLVWKFKLENMTQYIEVVNNENITSADR
jgi:class 3 adenylate cyclase